MTSIVNERYELVPLDRIRPHPRNPRKGDIAKIAESIDANGFYGAIVAQLSTGHILAGNHRWAAAKKAGLPSVPVLWVDVDDRVALKILLADNRTADVAGYDDEALAALLSELRAEEDLLGTGYTDTEVAELLDEAGSAVDAVVANDADDEVEALPAEPESRPGEIYELGPHRLLCGDATSVTDLDKLLGGKTVDLLWTDPPYNVDYQGKTKRKLGIKNDAMGDAAFAEFLVEAFSTASTAMRPGACFYIAHADVQGHQFRRAVLDVGWKLSQCLIWVKDQFVLGRADYHWRHEPMLYGWKDGAAHTPLADRTQDTVWECARPRRNEEHPTMKPVALIERAIRNSSKHGDAVLDPFAGSGSTLLAAERAGRVAFLIEIDPRYCDVIRRRWAKHVESTAASGAAAKSAAA